MTSAGKNAFTDERRSGLERRQHSGTLLRAIVEQLADGVLVVSQDGVIRFANPAAERLFGRSLRELEGRDLGLPIVGGESTEIDVVRPGGTTIVAELRAAAADWEGARASIVSVRDITDRKNLEIERVARARAEAANVAKMEFLTLMSHELRTPLNGVIGYAELLRTDVTGPTSAEQRAQLDRIHANGKHLLKLVDEMIDLARASEGRLALDHSSSSALAAATEALDSIRLVAASRGIELVQTDSCDARVMFAGDAVRVRQILAHLLDNAIKFSSTGGRVGIECGVAEEADPNVNALEGGPWVFWCVGDGGLGIPADQLTSIFDPFTQVDGGHSRAHEGSGLGLTISRSLARLMRGDLTVRSEIGRGSWFTLWLPAAPPSEAP